MKQLAAAVLIFITAFTSCRKDNLTGNGETRTETRPLVNFSQVEVAGRTDVIVTQGNTFKVEVKAYANLLPQLETKVVNGVLKIGFKSGISVVNDNSEVNITMPVLSRFVTDGASEIELLNGNALNFEAIVRGTSAINGFGFTTKEASVKIEGSGTIKLAVTDKLNARIVGTGIVTYDGNPSVSSDITGSGKVVRR